MAKDKEPTLTVDGKQYKMADLSAEAKAQLRSLQFADAEVQRLNMQLAVAKTARNAYRLGLAAALPKDPK